MLFKFICFIALLLSATFHVQADSREEVIELLNASSSMDVSDEAKSWKNFFDGCIKITPPPTPLSETFNMNTIWPQMLDWKGVAEWAAQNEHMEDVFLETTRSAIIGMPYGKEHVPAEFIAKQIVADIGVDGSLNSYDFGYIDTVKLACLWATSQTYALFEEGEIDRALHLMMSEMIVLRKFCNREFLKEKLTFMRMLGDASSNSRDMFYMYRDVIKPTQFRRVAMDWLPNIRIGPTSLLMPVGDQILSEKLLKKLFNSQGDADESKFKEVLAQMQVEVEPLTGFGTARYWKEMAEDHRGEGDSDKRMKMIYDDWWRRWKLRFFHPMLSTPTQFENANPIRYSAVKMIVRDTEDLFKERKTLLTQLNGTIVSAAICGYYNQFGEFPSSIKKMYAQFLHRINNLDPMRKNEMRKPEDWKLYLGDAGKFHYRLIPNEIMISTIRGIIPVESGQCLLYSISADEEDDGGVDADHDTIIWPPLKTLERNAGLLN